MAEENSTNFVLAPGEKNVYGDKFSPSVVVPYLKAEMMCSSTRYVYKVPNVLLGFIPVGTNENTIPVRSIASVSTSTKFMIGRFLLGVIAGIVGVTMVAQNFLAAVICLLFAFVWLVTAFPARITVTNHAGGTTSLTVSVFEKQKLSRFGQELQNRVFADLEQTRHEEAQATRLDAAQMNQMQMQQQMALQQQMLQQMQMNQMQNNGAGVTPAPAPAAPVAPAVPTGDATTPLPTTPAGQQ
ncbi:hypothetical protein B9G54_01270 [Alloscardovia macacae]|uniref:Uncharacterized protein n=1 Tax=Alloscardovia macacae TaxID=1160091 RepID=A0A1Y2SZC5_9BIFI|nr:hypothetical protein [Alloscardovia macacae]OTA27456.1 hypothetical protein B9G54_01270 [Alloscardovia macacae]OTA28256.1 hypothetical protein B9T39_07215 [Alloscardovia macacae]